MIVKQFFSYYAHSLVVVVRRDAFTDTCMAGTINGEAWQFIGLYSIKTLVQESLCLLMQIVVSAEQCHKNKGSILFCNVCFLFLRMLETSYRGMPKVASHNSFKFPIIIANAHA